MHLLSKQYEYQVIQYDSVPKVQSVHMDIVTDIFPQQLFKLNKQMTWMIENINDMKDTVFDVCNFLHIVYYVEFVGCVSCSWI